MRIRKTKGNGRSGFLCTSLCCIKASLWILFKKAWFEILQSLICDVGSESAKKKALRQKKMLDKECSMKQFLLLVRIAFNIGDSSFYYWWQIENSFQLSDFVYICNAWFM